MLQNKHYRAESQTQLQRLIACKDPPAPQKENLNGISSSMVPYLHGRICQNQLLFQLSICVNIN